MGDVWHTFELAESRCLPSPATPSPFSSIARCLYTCLPDERGYLEASNCEFDLLLITAVSDIGGGGH
jgi:hypothetical protein